MSVQSINLNSNYIQVLFSKIQIHLDFNYKLYKSILIELNYIEYLRMLNFFFFIFVLNVDMQ